MTYDFKKGDLVFLPDTNRKERLGLFIDMDLEHDEGLTIFCNIFVGGIFFKIDSSKVSHVN